MPLLLSDQDLAELNTLMRDMRGAEIQMLNNFISARLRRQSAMQAPDPAPPPHNPPQNGADQAGTAH